MTITTSELTNKPVDTSSEDWRHECECASVLRMPSREQRLAFISRVGQIRGQAAADRLKRDTLRLYEIRAARQQTA